MNDSELDRLLEIWDAPAPRRSLREGLRAQFPRAENFGFARPLRWALATLLASVALAVALAGAVAAAQSHDSLQDVPLIRLLNRMYENFMESREAGRATRIAAKIRQSEPKVYVDGRVAAPLEYGPAATMDIRVPGEGVFSITAFPVAERRTGDGQPTGWVEAGRIHGNVIELQAGSRRVRIECSQPIVDADRPVFAIHRP